MSVATCESTKGAVDQGLRMRRLAALGLIMGLAAMAYGLGGNLDQPPISIPTDGRRIPGNNP